MQRRRIFSACIVVFCCTANTAVAQQRLIGAHDKIADWNQHDDFRNFYANLPTDLRSGDDAVKYSELPTAGGVRFVPKTGPFFKVAVPAPANSRAFTAKDYFTATTGTIFAEGFNLAGGGWHCVPASMGVILNWARQVSLKELPQKTRRQMLDILAEDADTNDQNPNLNKDDAMGHMGTARQDGYNAFGKFIKQVPKYDKIDGPKLIEFRYSRDAYIAKINANLPVLLLYKNADSGNGHAVVGYGHWIDPDINFNSMIVMDPFFGRKDVPMDFSNVTDVDAGGTAGTSHYGGEEEIANSAPGSIPGPWYDVKTSFLAIPDYGDAPSSYDPIPAPAAHQVTVAEWLGAAVSSEVDKLSADDDADGFANVGNRDAYDDGVQFDFAPEAGIGQARVTVMSQTYEGGVRFDPLDTSKQLYLGGWGDFNRDMQWTPDEQIVGEFIGGPGIGAWGAGDSSHEFLYSFPAPLGFQESWFRFRLAYGEGVGPTGLTQFGEVEDYFVAVPEPCTMILMYSLALAYYGGGRRIRGRGRVLDDRLVAVSGI